MKHDHETQLHNSQIKLQQEDRSGITKPPTFLPRDPLMLQLMELQREGRFVSSLMGEGRLEGWAPELRGILSLEVVRRAGERKRKWDFGGGEGDVETPVLVLPREEDEGDVADFGGADATLRSDGIYPPPAQDEDQQQQHQNEEEEEEEAFSPNPAFETTELPLLPPSHSGPISLPTKNAVHLLRAHFAPSHPLHATEPPTPSKRVKGEAMFTDLCPEASTSRQDATKMFFELLVLGTKAAVGVEQVSGGGIRVRGKRGLWGGWAERGAGGGIGGEEVQAGGEGEGGIGGELVEEED